MNEEKERSETCGCTCGMWLFLIAVAVVIALLAGRSAGIHVANSRWTNMLIASGLANPDIADKVVESCEQERVRFKESADRARIGWNAIKALGIRPEQVTAVKTDGKTISEIKQRATEPTPDQP